MTLSPKRKYGLMEANGGLVRYSLEDSSYKRSKTSDGTSIPSSYTSRALKTLDRNQIVHKSKCMSVPGSPVLKGMYHFEGLQLDISPDKRGPSLDSYFASKQIIPKLGRRSPIPKTSSFNSSYSNSSKSSSPMRGQSPRRRMFDIFSDSDNEAGKVSAPFCSTGSFVSTLKTDSAGIQRRPSSSISSNSSNDTNLFKFHQKFSIAIDPPEENMPPKKLLPNSRTHSKKSGSRQISRYLRDLDIQKCPGYVTTPSISPNLKYSLKSQWYSSRVSKVLHSRASGRVPSFVSPPRHRPSEDQVNWYISTSAYMSANDISSQRSALDKLTQFPDATPFVIYNDVNEYKPFAHSPLEEIDIDYFEDKENLENCEAPPTRFNSTIHKRVENT